MSKPVVGILMGSANDDEVMNEAKMALNEFGITAEYHVMSAHRTPDVVAEYSKSARKKGIKVIIAGAGGAAHLAGVVAAHTTLPVIAVPIDSTPLHGLDSLLAMVQMPGGVPVATVAIGKAGAKNAGILAAQIISLSDNAIASKLDQYKVDQREKGHKANLR